jgi:hypothetical protein
MLGTCRHLFERVIGLKSSPLRMKIAPRCEALWLFSPAALTFPLPLLARAGVIE